MRVHLQALGCRLNEAELESWARDFRRLGHQITREARDADLLVVNTCAVTAESVRKSRNLIRKSQRANADAKLVMSGCYAALSPDQAAAELGVDLIVGNHEKDRLVEITAQAFGLEQAVPDTEEFALFERGRQRAFIKVQDGCRYRCTYCVVTLARGEERSRAIDEVVDEINLLHRQGVKEVVLAGVHLGGYGSDTGASLSRLVQAVLADTRMPRIRLGSLEPWELHDEFWDLFANPRLMPHLHLPIQSGSDSVLRRMSRRCRRDEFLALIDTARSQVPDICITTDIIVGFPGETEQEWQATRSLVAQAGFAHIHIFAFSPRQGTKAATLPLPVDRETKRQRSQQLHELAAEHKRRVLARHVDREFEVLLEGRATLDGTARWHGYTPNFLRVQLAVEDDLENRLVRIRTVGLNEDGESLLAELVEIVPA